MPDNRRTMFDHWSDTYDATVGGDGGFPFAGYTDVLHTIVRQAATQPGMSVLDLGVGTGNLARQFADLGCRVTGIDFSEEMLRQAQTKVPLMQRIQADIATFPSTFDGVLFDRIVSAYTFHELDTPTKAATISAYIRHCLHPRGSLLIGDISFPTRNDQEQAHQQWKQVWDAEEHYWNADEIAAVFHNSAIAIDYVQVGAFSGVYRFTVRQHPDRIAV